MSRPLTRAIRSLVLGTVPILLVAACSDSSGPDTTLSGSWSGTASFGSGFSASMTLTQNGPDVTGTLRIVAAVADAPVIGAFTSGTMVWAAQDGCEVWVGTLVLDGTSNRMEGPIARDVSACSSGTATSGTLRLDRQ